MVSQFKETLENLIEGGNENAPLFECFRQKSGESGVKAITAQPKREMTHQQDLKRVEDKMYRGAGDTISEESSEQDQSIEEIDSGESEVRIWNPALPEQQTRPRKVGGAPQGTTEQERIDHLLQQ